MQSEEIRTKALKTKKWHLYEKIMASDDEVVLMSTAEEFIKRDELGELRWHCKRCSRDFMAKPSYDWRRYGMHWARCLDCYPLNSNCSLK